MAYRFVTPRSNPSISSTTDIAYFVYGENSYVLSADQTQNGKVLFTLTPDSYQFVYLFSLEKFDFQFESINKQNVPAGWYKTNLQDSFDSIDIYTEFPDGIKPTILNIKNEEIAKTIFFEEGTTACKLAVLEETKLLTRLAIVNKGVDVPDGTTFRKYAEKISKIPSGSSVENVTGQLTGLRKLAISARYVLNGEVKITETESTETIQVQKNSLIFVTNDSPVTLSGLIEDVYSPGSNLKLCFVTGDFSVSM